MVFNDAGGGQLSNRGVGVLVILLSIKLPGIPKRGLRDVQ